MNLRHLVSGLKVTFLCRFWRIIFEHRIFVFHLIVFMRCFCLLLYAHCLSHICENLSCYKIDVMFISCSQLKSSLLNDCSSLNEGIMMGVNMFFFVNTCLLLLLIVQVPATMWWMNVLSSVQRNWHWHSTYTPQPFYGPFPGQPGWAGARKELLDFMVQGKINRGRHTDHPAGRHSVRTNQCPPLSSPIEIDIGRHKNNFRLLWWPDLVVTVTAFVAYYVGLG